MSERRDAILSSREAVPLVALHELIVGRVVNGGVAESTSAGVGLVARLAL